MSAAPVIRIKRAYVDLLPKFLLNRQRDIEQMRNALSKADFAAIRATAHRVKGGGAAYGFDELTVLGAELEALCARRDVAGIERLLDRMSEYMASAKIEIT